MNTLIVDERNGLKEIRKKEFPEQPKPVRVIASVISYIFHPVFVPVYIVAFLLYVHPFIFAGYTPKNKILVFAQAFMMLTFFPLVSVLLLKALKFIDSIYLHTQKDRVIPFIACMTWYFWLWYVWNNMGKSDGAADMPREAVKLALAIFITTIIGLMVNIKMKISLHAIAIGVLVCFLVLLAVKEGLGFGLFISIGILVAGIVCTARFIVSDHTQAEVYSGLGVGIISMLAAQLVG